MLSELELLCLRGRCLRALSEAAPLGCSVHAIVRAVDLATECMIEGMPAEPRVPPIGGTGCDHEYEARDTDGRLFCARCKVYLEE